MLQIAEPRPSSSARPPWVRLLAALLWLGVLTSMVWWALRLSDRSAMTPIDARESPSWPTEGAALSWPQLGGRLGAPAAAAAPPPPTVVSQIRVLGVVVQGREGRAVLQVEGAAPARPGSGGGSVQVLRVGERLASGEELLRVSRDEVVLRAAQGQGEVRLPAPAVDGARAAGGSRPPPPANPTQATVRPLGPVASDDARTRQDAAQAATRQAPPGEIKLPAGGAPGIQQAPAAGPGAPPVPATPDAARLFRQGHNPP